jgi:Ca2+-binding EF-hand superfamily protein
MELRYEIEVRGWSVIAAVNELFFDLDTDENNKIDFTEFYEELEETQNEIT